MIGTRKYILKKKKNKKKIKKIGVDNMNVYWSGLLPSILWDLGVEMMKIASNWGKPKRKLINGQAYSGHWHGSLMSLVMCVTYV